MLAWLVASWAVAFDPIVAPKWSRTIELPRFEHVGVVRRYHVVLPSNFTALDGLSDGAPGFPVIFAFHGNGADAAAFALQTPVLFAEAPIRGFILVYPDGVQTPGSELRCQARSWNSGSCCDEAFLAKVDDIKFIAAVLDDLLRRYPSADSNRVFATGSSNGGSMVVRIACELPHRFKAVAPEIGSFEGSDGAECAGRCTKEEGAEYERCEWDREKKGCRHRQWPVDTPEIYSCKALQKHPVSMLFFNGNLDPYSNVSGMIERPVKWFNGSYTSSFPPMTFALDYLREEMGCPHPHHKEVSFSNGHKGNHTRCVTYLGQGDGRCSSNMTYCLSDAGHRWYGSSYDVPKVCRWEGYAPEDCTWEGDQALYGPNTLSVSVAYQTLDFFGAIGWTGSPADKTTRG